MLSHWLFTLKNFSQKLWVRASLFALLGMASSLIAVILDRFVPHELADLVGGRAVDSILSMLASSMLIVVTFALSTMVAAYSSATQSATPRSTSWIIEDSGSQTAISMFLGAFIYSIVSLIALSTDYYGKKGRVILLAITILVLTAVIGVIIKWVGQLRSMGRVGETLKKVEQVGLIAFKTRAQVPTLGCQPFNASNFNGHELKANEVGHVQNIDIAQLEEVAEEYDGEFFVETDVGTFIHHHTTLVQVKGVDCIDDVFFNKVKRCFSIGDNRTFENDPKYALTVLSGVALKALSPGINDVGTAVDVTRALLRVLTTWHCEKEKCKEVEVKYKRIYLRPLKTEELFHESFYYISQSGSSHLQLIMALNQTLNALGQLEDKEFQRLASEQARLLYLRAKENHFLAEDLQIINDFYNLTAHKGKTSNRLSDHIN